MRASIDRRLGRIAAFISCLLLSISASAQSFSSKPVTLLAPYPAGGVSDVIARTMNNALGEQLGKPVIVENLDSASGPIAAQRALNQLSDGYVVFKGSPNELVLAPLAMSVKFNSNEFR